MGGGGDKKRNHSGGGYTKLTYRGSLRVGDGGMKFRSRFNPL